MLCRLCNHTHARFHGLAAPFESLGAFMSLDAKLEPGFWAVYQGVIDALAGLLTSGPNAAAQCAAHGGSPTVALARMFEGAVDALLAAEPAQLHSSLRHLQTALRSKFERLAKGSAVAAFLAALPPVLSAAPAPTEAAAPDLAPELAAELAADTDAPAGGGR